MAKVFVTQIKLGAITIDDVPKQWRSAVEVLLNGDT